MTDQSTDDDFWGEKGEEYWRDLGAQCGASELQIKFACARYQGASATGAAKLAGYAESPVDPGAIRQAGHKAIRSTAVAAMLALAAAEDEPRTTATKVMDKAGRVQLLSDIASKSPDPTLKIRAVEGLNKMDDTPAEHSQSHDTDGLKEWRDIREFLHQAPGGPLAIVSLWVGTGRGLANLPLLHDVYKAIMRDEPAFWERAVSNTELPGRQRLKNRLANPKWQQEARIKLWREVGVDLDPNNTVDLSFLDRQTVGQTTGDPHIITNGNGATQ